MIRLRTVFLHVTKACNLRCSYCYFSAARRDPDEMAAADYRSIWKDLTSLSPEKVVFTGGEPLVRDDLFRMLRDLAERDGQKSVKRCLNTNGHLMTADLAKSLIGLVDEVRVSLDGLPAKNDRLRGQGNFAAALHALLLLAEAGHQPKVLITVSSVSLPDLEELLNLLLDRKFQRINVNLFRPIGRGKRHLDWAVPAEAVRDVLKRVWQRRFPGSTTWMQALDPAPCSNCGVGSFLNIMPNGDVFPCHVLTNPEFRVGNVRTDGLQEICRSNGMLGELQQLDFRELAKQDTHVAQLAATGSCMGDVYASSSERPVWANNLPSLRSGKAPNESNS